MPLRRHTILIVGLVLVISTALFLLLARGLLFAGFLRLEAQHVEMHIHQVRNILESDLDALWRLGADWAWWDDTYAFIEDGNEDYIESNLIPETFSTLRVDSMLFVDQQGDVVFGGAYQEADQTVIPLSTVEEDRLLRLQLPAAESQEVTSRQGILLLPTGPAFVVVLPILTSEKSYPSRGTMIWSRELDADEVQRLMQIVQLPITIHGFHADSLALDLETARAALFSESPFYSQPVDDGNVAGYSLMNGIEGEPALIVKVVLPRDIVHEGEIIFGFLVLSTLVLGTIMSITTLGLLERAVLTRIFGLTREIQQISETSDSSVLVTVAGGDEIADLARSINAMLDGLRRSQEQLKQTHEQLGRTAHAAALGEIAAGIAHQVNNPLTAIITEAYLALKKLPPDSELRPALEAIEESAQLAGSAVHQMLDLSRVVPYDMGRLDVNQSLQNAVDIVAFQIKPYAKLIVDLAPDLPPIKASGQHLEDVVWINLLLNARDAVRGVDRVGEIRVSTTYNAEERVIEAIIQDNGIGISEANLPKIFNPFFTTKENGTGLGLSICLDVVERHGGFVRVESREGFGTRFILKLPVDTSDESFS